MPTRISSQLWSQGGGDLEITRKWWNKCNKGIVQWQKKRVGSGISQ
jgi:hypothetical protein